MWTAKNRVLHAKLSNRAAMLRTYLSRPSPRHLLHAEGQPANSHRGRETSRGKQPVGTPFENCSNGVTSFLTTPHNPNVGAFKMHQWPLQPCLLFRLEVFQPLVTLTAGMPTRAKGVGRRI